MSFKDQCGPVNPLMGMASNINNATAQVDEIRAMMGAQHGVNMNMPGQQHRQPSMDMMMHQHQRPADDMSGFVNDFHSGAALNRPMMGPMPPFGPMSAAPRAHAMPQAPENLAREFERVSLQNQAGSPSLEQAFAQSRAAAPIASQAGPMNAGPMNAMPMGLNRMAGPMMGMGMGMNMMAPMMPMSMMGGMGGFAPYMQRSYGPMMSGPMQSAPISQQQQPVQQSQQPAVVSQAPATVLQDQNLVNSVEPAVAEAEPVSSGGMNAEMIEQLRNSDNPKWRNSKFLKFISRIQNGEIELKDNQVIEKVPERESEFNQDWGGDFMARYGGLDELGEYDDLSENYQGVHSPFMWESGSDENKIVLGQQELKDFDWTASLAKAKEMTVPPDPEYQFVHTPQTNPMSDVKSPFEEGLRLLRSGETQQAISAFEAELQARPDNAEAWRYLGQAHAENEAERQAIACLLKAVSLDPYNLPALMTLGVSFANDLDESRSLNYLKTWLLNNPEYQDGALAAQRQSIEEYEQLYGGGTGQSMDVTLHDEVIKMFVNATTINSNDSDLYTVLGVLYHLTEDYDKSIESFKTSLRLQPEDPFVWNKLGATQANNSRSAEASHAYRRALQLRPKFVRALTNLAISYANQGKHDDAARAYLDSLSHNPEADHVWSYLRISLSRMGRDELVELTHSKNTAALRQALGPSASP